VPSRLRVATRGSQLAKWQAQFVADRLLEAHPGLTVELLVVETTGDRRLDIPIWEMGGQGVFVREVQAAVLDGRADLAVHSAKDLPSTTAPGLDLACVPVRADARDALIGSTLAELPPGARVATGSVRRRAQLAWLRPDLTFAALRGNIATRIAKAADHHAVVVAAAALYRLGLADQASEVLSTDDLLPQVGQGALAVECRAGDDVSSSLLAAIEDPAARRAVDAERGFLARLGGGCDLPVGAYAVEDGDGRLIIDGFLATLDGRILLRDTVTGPPDNGPGLGSSLAERLLFEAGGSMLLEDLAS
jgi:hydroxymethylbilane synthase